ncbi:MOSC domain-containing protein [Acetobacter lambici]|uniref:MOSC domain-containing protein n=1 Tax=Acetobacter lambici TaxID=1332824 RepID=A0ABT1F8J4_9PROT|nr:MOSC domain-containing protein [Acetobacter lambici]MCP1244133.1 MOSC domain-containing protein [Acetobacter lambici]MCP1260129.1 MOSC domain-containing protein [Acetobacter lambici]NHO58339.1 MOSC domain-containing protein [Acetobacter lambici]
MHGKIERLYNYPIKGLSAQPVEQALLRPGDGFPDDRLFGFARHDSGFDQNDPQPLPKDRFVVQVKEERLAGLVTHFDSRTRHMRILVKGNVVFERLLIDGDAIRAAENFIATMFDLDEATRPTFACSGVHRFTDVSVVSKELMNAISLINLDSVRDMEERIKAPIDPLRFRANVYFSGWPAGRELEMVGRTFRLGAARLRVMMRTRRCAATEVDPTTARRDLQIPRLIMQNYGHADMGIYAEVIEGGEIRLGEAIHFEEVFA